MQEADEHPQSTPVKSGPMLLTRWLFLRGLALVYAFAFASCLVQIRGLVGSNGILPVDQTFTALRQIYGTRILWALPSIFWLNSSDAALVGACLLGVIVALALLIGFAQRWLLIVLYVLYLSLVNAGQDFMSFQWDILLLEAGFLAIFLAPAQLMPRPPHEEESPLPVIVWLFRWLIFRLMFGSGVSKLLSGDPNWRNLTAVSYHYWTQPLPTVIAWYAALLPLWADRIATFLTLAIEMLVPFLYFGPQRLRFAGAACTTALMLIIAATGNYTFFNLLTIVLCILLLDDALLTRLIPSRIGWLKSEETGEHQPTRLWRGIATTVGVLLGITSVLLMGLRFGMLRGLPPGVADVVQAATNFNITSNYGLFAVMTTERPEILIEGSNDGTNWLRYEFRYKPGDEKRPPLFVAPHQPRLDWQLWFAALQGPERALWFRPFLSRLLDGSPEVLALLEYNPFPDAPPKYIRAVVTNYRFTDWSTRQETGQWWTHGPVRAFYP